MRLRGLLLAEAADRLKRARTARTEADVNDAICGHELVSSAWLRLGATWHEGVAGLLTTWGSR